MPYSDMSKVPPSLKGISPPITLAQANEIASNAEAIERRLGSRVGRDGEDGRNSRNNPWAIAISQFKNITHVVSPDGKRWVRRERTNSEAETLGRMEGPEATAPDGKCVCPECGYETEHDTGKPCYEMECPECGAQMIRATEDAGESLGERDEAFTMYEGISWRLPPFASPGGKYNLAPTIAGMLPEHQTYVEPFAGAGSILFAKDVAPKEILNDQNPEIAHALRILRALDYGAMEQLSRMNWMPSKVHWHWLESYEPETDLESLYRYLYLNWYRYGATGRYRKPKHFNPRTVMPRILQARVRLSRVDITNEDALVCIDEHDAPDTVMYIDPPHPGVSMTRPGSAAFFGYTEDDFADLVTVLESAKGRFVLSIDDKPERRQQLEGFNVRPLTLPKAMPHGSAFDDGRLVRVRNELLVTNFKAGGADGH